MSVEYEDETLRLMVEDNLLVARWLEAPRMSQLLEMRRLNVHLASRFSHQTALLNVICSGTPSFSPEVHRETSDQALTFGARGLGTAHLVMVDGLVGMTVRSFLSTISLVARSSGRTQVFGDFEEVSSWMLPRLEKGEVAWTDARLRSVFDACLA